MDLRIVEEALELTCRKVNDISKIDTEKVCIGLGYTGVKLSTGHAGLCHTQQSELPPQCCQVNDKAGTFAGSSALELASLVKSWDFIKNNIGIATLNALFQVIAEGNPSDYSFSEENILDFIEIKIDDTVVMIGKIESFIQPIKDKTDRLFIIERNPLHRNGAMLPDTACEEYLPKADILLITGSAIANGSIDYLLNSPKNAREIIMVGPTCGLIPDPFFNRGVTAIGGVKITNANKALQIIAEGGGTKALKSAMKFTTIKPEK
jgi:uncharacterized protein (DUF4213/DUF364 family)